MLPTAPVTSPAQARALDATLDLVARWGLGKTTLTDVARAAGMSRATLYRAFPGGRDQLVELLGQREAARFLDTVARAFDAAPDLTTALADGLHAATLHLRSHRAASYVLEHEPELAVPVLGFGQMDRLLATARRALGPHLVAHVPAADPRRAEWAAEWAARLFLSGLVNTTPEFDLADPAVCRRLVARYVAPALCPDPTPIALTS